MPEKLQTDSSIFLAALNKMKENIVLIGGGGHCRSVIDIIEEQGMFDIAGIVDKREKIGSSILGYKIFGTDDDLPRITKEFKNFCIAIGHIKSNSKRKEIFLVLKKYGANLPVIKSPHAYISKSARANEGCVIMHHAVINANAVLGVCGILNTGSIIEHDVIVGDHCHIGPSATVNGGCVIENDCFIGSNAAVIPGITVKNNSLIAAGSVIICEVEAHSLYAGNPSRLKKQVYG